MCCTLMLGARARAHSLRSGVYALYCRSGMRDPLRLSAVGLKQSQGVLDGLGQRLQLTKPAQLQGLSMGDFYTEHQRQLVEGVGLFYASDTPVPSDFGWFVTHACTNKPSVDTKAYLEALVHSACYESAAWATPPPTRGRPFVSNATPAEGAAFAALGEGEVALNAKLISCACEASPTYIHAFDAYLGDMRDLSRLVSIISTACIAILFCFCCCCSDRDEYHDSELL